MISSAPALDAVFQEVVHAAARFLGAAIVSLWTVDEAARTIEAQAFSDPDAGGKFPRRRLSVDEDAIGWVATHRCPVEVPDVFADARMTGLDWWRAHRLRSLLALPGIREGELLVILALHGGEPFCLHAQDRDLLEDLASRAATATRNARRSSQPAHGPTGIERFVWAARAVAASPELGTLAGRLVERVESVFHGATIVLWLRQPDGSLKATASRGARLGPSNSRPVMPPGAGIPGRAVAESRPVWTQDVRNDPDGVPSDDLRDCLGHSGLRALLAVPLRVRNAAVGVLSVGCSEAREFSASEIALLEALGDYMALDLENASLLEESEVRRRRLATLVHVAQRLTRRLDLSQVLNSIAEATAAIFEGEAGFRLLEGEELVRIGGTPGARAVMVRERLRLGESLAGRVAAAGKPLIAEDTRADARLIEEHRSAIDTTRTGALMCLPVRLEGQILGTLHIFRERGYRFGTEALELATSVAEQAAIAIQNARLYEEADRRRRVAEALAAFGSAISASPHTQTVLDLVAERASALLRTERAAVAILERDGPEPAIRFVARHGMSSEFPERTRPAHWRDGTTPRAIRERRPIWSGDLLQDQEFTLSPQTRKAVEAEGYRAVLSVPLLVGNQVLGALVVYRDMPSPFGHEQVELLQAFAAHAAIAIDKARLYDDVERRRREAEVLAELARSINSALDLDTVLQRVAEAAKELCASDIARVALRDAESGTMVFRYGVGARSSEVAALRAKPGVGIAGRVVVTGRPFRTGNYAADPRISKEYLPVAKAEGIISAMAAPIQIGGAVEGLLHVDSRAPNAFTDREEAVLLRLADQAAVAIRNARLYTSLEVRASRLTTLTNLNRVISSSLDTDTVLHEIARAAATLMNVPVVSFWVADEATGSLRVRAFSDDVFAQDFPFQTLRFGEGSLGQIALLRKPLAILEALADERILARAWWQRHGLRSFLGLPIISQDALLGVLSLNDYKPIQLQPEESALLESFVAQAAAAIRNARVHEERTQAYEELSRTQDQLVQSQKMEAVGRLAGGVAHDFNNLLTVVLGRSEMLLHRLDAQDPMHRHVSLIRSTAHRAAALTQQLLAFSRRQMLQARVLDLNLVMADAGKMLGRLIGEDIELLILRSPGSGSVRADPTQLEQVLLNLAVNARDAMPRGGRLTIETASVDVGRKRAPTRRGADPGRYVMLAVSDTGLGMDPHTQEHLFEPFFTTKGPGKGTGLGLATVYGIVKQHGGFIDVESAVGRGTTFRIYLPRVDQPAGPGESGSIASDTPRGWETVLVVEDEDGLRELAHEILQMHGYTVLAAPGGREALALAAGHVGPIHLLLTDVVMPQMSGRELADQLLQVRSETRVLFMSGYTEDTFMHHGVLDSGTNFLRKPFTPDALARKLREVLDARPAT